MKRKTLTGYLYQHTYNITVDIVNNLDYIISDNKDYFSQAEYLQMETFVFINCWIIIKLKENKIIVTKNDAEIIMDIHEKLMEKYIDYFADLNNTNCIEEIIREIPNRLTLYEDNYIKGFEYFIQVFYNIISNEFIELKTYKKNIYNKLSNTEMSAKDVVLFLKTNNSLDFLVEIFFGKGMNDYLLREKKDDVDFFENDNKIHMEYYEKGLGNVSPEILIKKLVKIIKE